MGSTHFFITRLQKGNYLIKRCVLVFDVSILYAMNTGEPPESDKEDEHMALNNLASWDAQRTPAACGSACGRPEGR